MKNQLSLSPLIKAINSLGIALTKEKDEFIRDAVIQRFEYTYELCWKTLRKYLSEQTGVKEFNIKGCFREAGKQGLIDNVEQWFEFHTARNLISHTYDEAIAENTYEAAKAFYLAAKLLLEQLKNSSRLF